MEFFKVINSKQNETLEATNQFEEIWVLVEKEIKQAMLESNLRRKLSTFLNTFVWITELNNMSYIYHNKNLWIDKTTK